MASYGLPYFLEDRTGNPTNTEFDDLLERMFIGVSSMATNLGRGQGTSTTVRIVELGSRSSERGFSTAYPGREPTIVLELGSGSGSVFFTKRLTSMPIDSWLRRSAQSTSTLERTFQCSDGEVYKWAYRGSADSEWTCTTSNGYLAAEYKLKTPGEPQYRSSGNALSITEVYGQIAVELVASLVAMRFIQGHSH